MVFMKLARINGRCAELASSTYFQVVKSQLRRIPGASAVNFFQTLPDKENNYLISGNEQSCQYGAIMIN